MSTTLFKPTRADVTTELGRLEIKPMSSELIKFQEQSAEAQWLAVFYVAVVSLAVVGAGLLFISYHFTGFFPTLVAFFGGLICLCASPLAFWLRHSGVIRLRWTDCEVALYNGSIPESTRDLSKRLRRTFGDQSVVVRYCRFDPFLAIEASDGLVIVACWKGTLRQRIVYDGAAVTTA